MREQVEADLAEPESEISNALPTRSHTLTVLVILFSMHSIENDIVDEKEAQ